MPINDVYHCWSGRLVCSDGMPVVDEELVTGGRTGTGA